MEKVTVSKMQYGAKSVSSRRLEGHCLLMEWRKKNAHKMKGLDAVKIIRALRDGTIR